jgi:hypothetical protein
MHTSNHTIRNSVLLALALCFGVATAWAGGNHHGHRGHSKVNWGMSIGYPGPYWGGYGYYPRHAYGPVYGPRYGPAYVGSISLGYAGGHHNAWSVGLSLPLYFGPRYQPQLVPVAVPITTPAAALPVATTASRRPNPACRQVREYQTEIVIGGRSVPAYGNACLQADGSWQVISGPIAAN